jgi:NADPH:quinone reductase-like Zn-dependent oxidoreductase
VITTCGPHNFDLVKSYGADIAFDYHDPDCAKKIREYTNDSIKHVFDTVSEGTSANICSNAMASSGGNYTSILAVDFPRKDVNADVVFGYTINGEPFKMGPKGALVEAKPEDRQFGEKFWNISEELLSAGKFKGHRYTVGSGGLHGVMSGLQRMKEGKVSGEKLVYRVDDMP